MKLVINNDWGGFGLSQEAYAKLIEWGIPVVDYVSPERDPITGKYPSEPDYGHVVFRGGLGWGTDDPDEEMWDDWTRSSRDDPLVVRVVEELGSKRASSSLSCLNVVEIPDGTDYEIHDYDGMESIHETHRSWS